MMTNLINSSCHFTNHVQIRAIYLTYNLQFRNIILNMFNSVRQSTSLIQFNFYIKPLRRVKTCAWIAKNPNNINTVVKNRVFNGDKFIIF